MSNCTKEMLWHIVKYGRSHCNLGPMSKNNNNHDKREVCLLKQIGGHQSMSWNEKSDPPIIHWVVMLSMFLVTNIVDGDSICYENMVIIYLYMSL